MADYNAMELPAHETADSASETWLERLRGDVSGGMFVAAEIHRDAAKTAMAAEEKRKIAQECQVMLRDIEVNTRALIRIARALEALLRALDGKQQVPVPTSSNEVKSKGMGRGHVYRCKPY